METQIKKWSEKLSLNWESLNLGDALSDHDKVAAILLLILRMSVDNAVWHGKWIRFYQGLPSRIEMAASAEDLPTFANDLAKELPAKRIGINDATRQVAAEICWCAEAPKVLDAIQRKPLLLATLMQVIFQSIKDYQIEDDMKGLEDEYDKIFLQADGAHVDLTQQ